MNKKQFSKVLKIGMKQYKPHTLKDFDYMFMCNSIEVARDKKHITQWECVQSLKKINKLLGHRTLATHLQVCPHKAYEVKMDFWKQHIIGEI